MSEENGAGEAPPIIINGQYVKDLSFEVPNAPAIYAEMSKSQPEIGINIDVSVSQIQSNVFEVTLNLESKAKMGDKVAFVAEVSYAGVVTLNVPEEHLHPMLLIECPRLLFPFARNVLAAITRDGGFPPVMLQPVDFVQLYQQRMEAVAAEQRQKEAEAEAEGEVKPTIN